VNLCYLREKRREKGFGKLEVLANFLYLGEKWEADYLDIYLNVLSKFGEVVEIVSSLQMISEVGYGELSDIIFGVGVCGLDEENRNMLGKFMEGRKYMDAISSDYRIEFEPVMKHYFFL
jgi:hypothetical protein